jgi:hypothetical protein
MKAYLYDIDNFFYGTTELMESPLEPGVFGDIPFSTKTEPPEIIENQIQFWNGSNWEIKPDYSRKIYYSKLFKTEKEFKRGEPFSDIYTDLKPPSESYYTWQIDGWKIDPELYSKFKIDNCKNQAKMLIAKSDWSVLPDRSIMIENISNFIDYRNTLLNLIINPVENPDFPKEPDPIWKNS